MRVVGKRGFEDFGAKCPSQDTIRWIADGARRAPRVIPKGIYRYWTHEDADRDMNEWVTNGIVERVQNLRFGADSPELGSVEDQSVCRAATWEDVLMVTGLLEDHRAKYVLVGGYALAANGIARQTGDIDILVENFVENNARWIAALAELPDHEAGALVGESDPFRKVIGGYGDREPGVIRIADEIMIDVVPRACGLDYGQLVQNVARIDVGGGRDINVLDLYGLWLTKQSPRDKDRADNSQIEYALTKLKAWPADHDVKSTASPTAKPSSPSPSPTNPGRLPTRGLGGIVD